MGANPCLPAKLFRTEVTRLIPAVYGRLRGSNPSQSHHCGLVPVAACPQVRSAKLIRPQHRCPQFPYRSRHSAGVAARARGDEMRLRRARGWRFHAHVAPAGCVPGRLLRGSQGRFESHKSDDGMSPPPLRRAGRPVHYRVTKRRSARRDVSRINPPMAEGSGAPAESPGFRTRSRVPSSPARIPARTRRRLRAIPTLSP